MADNDNGKGSTKTGVEDEKTINVGGDNQENKEHREKGSPDETLYIKLDQVKDKSSDSIKDTFGVSKEEILRQLDEAKNIKQRVDLFAKWKDKYGLEALLSLLPFIGDGGSSIMSTCYLFYQGRQIGLGWKDMLKIFGYQAADFILGSIPLFGDIVDFFFKANVYSSKIFSKHIEKLEQIAIEKGATEQEIESINRANKEILQKFDNQNHDEKNYDKQDYDKQDYKMAA